MRLPTLVCFSIVVGFSLACGGGDDPATPSPAPVTGVSGSGSKEDPYVLDCTSKARDLGSGWSTVFVKCPSNCSSGSVWGTCEYTFDSSVCRAAIHSGAMPPGKGGMTKAVKIGGRESYDASTQNGITSSSWGSYGETLSFAKMRSGRCRP